MARVLVIRGGAIGDFILTLPAIRLLKEDLPDARISILGYPSIAGLALTAGLAEEVRPIEHGPLAGFFAPGTELEPEWSAYFAGFDLVVSYLHDPNGHFRANLERAGVRNLVEGISKVDASSGVHASRQLAAPLESLALYLDDPAPALGIAPSRRAESGPLVAVHPGSGSAAKNWHLESWERLGRELAAEFSARILLVSGEAEECKHAEVTSAWRAAGVPFAHLHQLPLPELAERLAACSLFLGHDSGVSHLAAAAGARCLLLFGPTDPGIWAPANRDVEVIRGARGDMGSIGYGEVADRARALLSCP